MPDVESLLAENATLRQALAERDAIIAAALGSEREANQAARAEAEVFKAKLTAALLDVTVARCSRSDRKNFRTGEEELSGLKQTNRPGQSDTTPPNSARQINPDLYSRIGSRHSDGRSSGTGLCLSGSSRSLRVARAEAQGFMAVLEVAGLHLPFDDAENLVQQLVFHHADLALLASGPGDLLARLTQPPPRRYRPPRVRRAHQLTAPRSVAA